MNDIPRWLKPSVDLSEMADVAILTDLYKREQFRYYAEPIANTPYVCFASNSLKKLKSSLKFGTRWKAFTIHCDPNSRGADMLRYFEEIRYQPNRRLGY